MAINTSKPTELSEAEIEAWEGKPENRSRGKIQKVSFPSDVNPDKPADFWIAKPNRKQLAVITDSGTTTEKANDLIINTAVVAGDLDQLEFDDDMYWGLLGESQSLVKAKKKI